MFEAAFNDTTDNACSIKQELSSTKFQLEKLKRESSETVSKPTNTIYYVVILPLKSRLCFLHICKASEKIKGGLNTHLSIHNLSRTEKEGRIGYWIGGSDVEIEGVWIWMKNWQPGEPNHSGGHEDCLLFYAGANTFQWVDAE
ncbi:hypothetical protein KUTeg_020343 [Tegillarca granosa]|uniref:C-type lectin domain-containing protein n=1 Tax=Tegillarca granosa TaxID=220873 RepID=A0ABQ9E7K3_TEGGR|nr:hypothetical protein KUTeg_020343 [Tegillarca granosa]